MRVLDSIKKPFVFINNKTKPAREFFAKGQLGSIVFEVLLASQFLTTLVWEFALYKIPLIACFAISAAVVVLVSEVLSLIIKLLFAGGKRCRGYFAVCFFCLSFYNLLAVELDLILEPIIMSYLLTLAADILGRFIVAIIRTKRFKQVIGYILLALSLIYIGLYGYFYHVDRFGRSRVDFYNNIPTSDCVQVSGFDRYLTERAFEVESLSYGPDGDIMTNSTDLNMYGPLYDLDPVSEFSVNISDYDFAQTPIRGQIWYPKGQTNCPVLFFVHGNHASNVPSYLGYDYLGNYLASNGYAVVSVDENIINETGAGNDMRAILLLENMKAILNNSELSEIIDEDRIAIGGHSRGGEMVATAYLFNDLDAYPEDGNIRFDYHFNITSIVAIAPCVDQYRPVGRSVELEDVNYLLIHGSNDQDVNIVMGEKQYNNITFTGNEFCFKSSVYILGANHGQFNNQWGRYDNSMAFKGYLNTYNFIEQDEQQQIAMAYIRTFLDTTFGIDNTYESLMRDVSAYTSYLPDTVYITNYEDSTFTRLMSFDDTVDIVNSGEARINVLGTTDWTIVPYVRGDGGEGEDYVLEVDWDEGSTPVVDVQFESIDISGGGIGFAIADLREDTEDINETFNYTVELTDANGNTISVDEPVVVYHSLALQLWKQNVLFDSYQYRHQLQTVFVTCDQFEEADFDFTNVVSISISADGSEEGSMIINEVVYYE